MIIQLIHQFSLQELIGPYFPQGTKSEQVRICYYPDWILGESDSNNLEEFQKLQQFGSFQGVDYVVIVAGLPSNEGLAFFKGVYSVVYSEEIQQLNSRNGAEPHLNLYFMNKLPGFDDFENKVKINFTNKDDIVQLWSDKIFIVDGLDVDEYKRKRLAAVFKEFVDFSDWSYSQNNGEYSKEKAINNKYIKGKFKSSFRSDIVINGKRFGWTYNQTMAGKKMWLKGYVNDGRNNIVYDRSVPQEQEVEI